jgi:hypothetical protein
MIKYEFQLRKGKLKKRQLHIFNELLIIAIENKPNKKGEYSIALDQLLSHGISKEQLQQVLKAFTDFKVEWTLTFPVTVRGNARLLQDAKILTKHVKFRFFNSLLSKIIDDPHFFAMLEAKLSKIAS